MAAVGSVDLSTQIMKRLSELGLPQAAIARRMGIDGSVINLWAAGKRQVPALRVRGLASALECTVEALMTGAAPEPAPADRVSPPPEESVVSDAYRLARWHREQQVQALILAQRVAEEEQRARDRKRWPENWSAAVGGPLRGPERVPGRPEGDWVLLAGGVFEFVERVA